MVSDETIRLRNANFQVQFLQLCFVYGGRSVDHHITSGIVFRKCYKIPNSFLSAQNCYQTVQTKSESTMRRCAVLKRVQEKAKLLLCLVCCKSEVFKHYTLCFLIVDTDRATANFIAVEYKVICICANFARVGIQKMHVFFFWRGERMVHRMITACFVIPLQ